MDSGELNILFAEIDDQQNEIARIIGKIDDRSKGFADDIRMAESLAYQFHNLYSAIEDLFKIVARFFENTIESASGYHIELLNRMTLNIEGVRPALISKDTAGVVNDFRAFRHFFRHSYSADIDSDKIQLLLAKLDLFKKRYAKDIVKFKKTIHAFQSEGR